MGHIGLEKSEVSKKVGIRVYPHNILFSITPSSASNKYLLLFTVFFHSEIP